MVVITCVRCVIGIMASNLFYSQVIIVIISALFVFQSDEAENMDTSLYDFVSYGVFEDLVDLLEYTAWMGRRVKDNIDELLENSFILLSKQQEMLQPVIKLAEQNNRTDCTESVFMNVTDIVFREYFNMNLNCPLIGQRMSIFFNEIHNVTSRIADIHRRYINRAVECGHPLPQQQNRECLQRLIDGCREETDELRNFMVTLNQDVDEFMDGQEEEAFDCSMQGMRLVRSAAKEGIDHIRGCLNVDSFDYNKEYDSPMVKASMGLVTGPFDRIRNVLENLKKPTVEENPLQYVPPTQPYYQPNLPNQPHFPPNHLQMHMYQPQPGMPQPQMHPHMYQPQPGMPQPQMHPHMYQPQPGMPQPQMHPHMYQPQPGMPQTQMHPHTYQPQPGMPQTQMHPHTYQPQPGMPQTQMHPHMYQPQPGMPQTQMHPHMYQPQPGMPHPQMQPAMYPQYPQMQPPHTSMHPPQPPNYRAQNLMKAKDKTSPPWKIDTKAIPRMAYKNNLVRDDSFEFDSTHSDDLDDTETEYADGKEGHDEL